MRLTIEFQICMAETLDQQSFCNELSYEFKDLMNAIEDKKDEERESQLEVSVSSFTVENNKRRHSSSIMRSYDFSSDSSFKDLKLL
jgi:hypothetical protein